MLPLKQFTGAELASKYHVYAPSDLAMRCEKLRSGDYIVEGLLPRQSLGIFVGPSGSARHLGSINSECASQPVCRFLDTR